MIITGKLQSIDFWILENVNDLEAETTIDLKIDNHISALQYPSIMHKCELYDDAIGQWYLFAGHLMTHALIRADSFQSAYDIYHTQFVREDEFDPTEDVDNDGNELGHWDSQGGWYSETTEGYICSLPIASYVFRVELTQ